MIDKVNKKPKLVKTGKQEKLLEEGMVFKQPPAAKKEPKEEPEGGEEEHDIDLFV